MARFAFGMVAALVLVPVGAGGRASCPAPRDLPEPEVEFVGVALDGPAEPSTGHLLSPARFRVDRWETRDGADEIDVQTAVEVDGELVRTRSDRITPRAGERWRIRGNDGPGDLVVTSTCLGSELLTAAPADAPPLPAPVVETLAEPASGPGDDRALSLGVAAAGAVAIAVVLTRRSA